MIGKNTPKCWICGRTQSELDAECALHPELKEVHSTSWHGLHICDVCKDVLTTTMTDCHFITTLEVEDIITTASYDLKVTCAESD